MSDLYYLATPYSAYKGGRQEAYEDACKKAGTLMLAGYNIFCPIAHSHAIESVGLDSIQDGIWWLKQDFAVLQHCKKLLVFKMPGWDASYGVAKEIEFAKNNNIEVVYLEYEFTGNIAEAALS